MLDRDTQDYYERYFDLFTHPGWKDFIKDNASRRAVLSELVATHRLSEADAAYLQGQIYAVDFILRLDVTMRQSYDTLREESVVSNAEH